MSRGLGKLQNALTAEIRRHGKPVTFAEIREGILLSWDAEPGTNLSASFERSIRRALHTMVINAPLIELGDGGRGDPLRYFIHPIAIGCMGRTPEADALMKALTADSGWAKLSRTL